MTTTTPRPQACPGCQRHGRGRNRPGRLLPPHLHRRGPPAVLPRRPGDPPRRVRLQPARLGTGQDLPDRFSGAYAERPALIERSATPASPLRHPPRLPRRPLRPFPQSPRRPPRRTRHDRRRVPLRHRTHRHLDPDRPDAHAAPRGVRRVRTGHDHRPRRRRHGRKAARAAGPAAPSPTGCASTTTTTSPSIRPSSPSSKDLHPLRPPTSRCATIATELNDNGHRTRTGRRCTAKVVLGILRNRGYLGEISFRDVATNPIKHSSTPSSSTRPRPSSLNAAKATTAASPTNTPTTSSPDSSPACAANATTSASPHAPGHRYRYYTCWTANATAKPLHRRPHPRRRPRRRRLRRPRRPLHRPRTTRTSHGVPRAFRTVHPLGWLWKG